MHSESEGNELGSFTFPSTIRVNLNVHFTGGRSGQ